MNLNITTTTDGPPPAKGGGSKRWAEVRESIAAAAPGEWVVVRDLTVKEMASLRTMFHKEVEQFSSRKQDDGTYHVWVLRAAAASQSAFVAPNPIQASTGVQT